MEKIALEYLGGGFLPGVPARNLTDEEAKEHGGVKALLKSGLYQEPKADKSDVKTSSKASKKE